MITFQRRNFDLFEKPVDRGMIVVNPPHGIRMGDEFFMEELYKNLGFKLKSQCSGWTLWLLSGGQNWTQFLSLKSSKSYSIDNGGVDCRWLRYDIR